MSEWRDNEYPTDAALKRIRAWDWHDFRGLIAFVRSIWWPDSAFGWTEESDGDATKYTIATGGWSGNEDVIEALGKNLMFWSMCWQASYRGGRYEFIVKPIKP